MGVVNLDGGWMSGRGGDRRAARISVAAALTAALAVAVCACAWVVAPAASAALALSWTAPAPADALARPTGVACPGASLCVLVDRAGSVLTSADPTAPTPAWVGAPADPGQELTAVSCASASLCVAVDAKGDALASVDPSGGAGAWRSQPVDGAALTGVSCPSDALCVAVDAEGNALVSTEPARDLWHPAVEVDHGERLTGVSCSSAPSCVAVDAAGGVVSTAAPSAGAGAWSRRQLDSTGGLTAVSCASSSGVCVAVDASGDALASSDPSGPSPTWSTTGADPGRALAAVSCAVHGLCVAVDGGGSALASEAPAGSAPGWSSQPVDAEGLVAIGCFADSFCLAVDGSGRALSATLPVPPAPVSPPPVPRPSILGAPALAARLICQPGVTVDASVRLDYSWLREGSEPIAGADGPLYTVARGDEGRHLQCRVTAVDGAGSASGTSAFVTVPFEGLPVAAGETVVGAFGVRAGRIFVPVSCSGRAPRGCSLLLRLMVAGGGSAGGGAPLGSRRLRVARGARVAATVGLSAVGRRLLARRRSTGALLLVSGTVIGAIEAALAEQPVELSVRRSRVSVRLLAASCGACAVKGGLFARFAATGEKRDDRWAANTSSSARAAAAVLVAAGAGSHSGHGVLAATPYMGWDSYFAFGADFSESTVLEQASDLLTLGLARRGYRYVWLDAGWWQGARAPGGQIVLDRQQWPHGMAWLASTLHRAGLLLGVYTDAGENGCGGVGQGSYGHYSQDADTFAAWGVDAVKVDFCGGEQQHLDPASAYRAFRTALDSTPSRRPTLLSICDFLQPGERGSSDPLAARSAFTSYLFGPEVGNSWRTDGDVGVPGHVPFANVLRNLDADAAHPQAAGPGHWNDPDYLGPDQGMGVQQFRTQLSMWAMLAAPLMVSRDLGRLSAASLAALRDQEVIAIDQDPLGAQGTLVASEGDAQVWAKPLADGARAVALLNRGSATTRIETSAAGVGLPAAKRYSVRDLWRRASSASSGPIAAQVPGYGTVLLQVSAVRQAGH